MTKLRIPTKLLNLTKMAMGNNMGTVKIQGILLYPFIVQNGLRQGDPLSTTLFNLALEYAARKITVNSGGNIYNRLYQHLAYADDLCTIARRISSLSTAFEEFEGAASKTGLLVNENTTKYLIRTSEERNTFKITITNWRVRV
jgi:hypothetical protein